MTVGPGRLESHWDDVYGDRAPTSLSWYEAEPVTSLALVDALGLRTDEAAVDVGGGASVLVDALHDRGVADLTVLDVSEAALRAAQDRMGPVAADVTWLHHDVLEWRPLRRYGLWHDRAVFHFLVDPGDRARYVQVLRAALADRGAVILGTFAEDGPQQCSGLPVARYRPEELVAALGPGFDPVDERRAEHTTPAGVVQPFTWVALRAALPTELPGRARTG